MGDRPDFYDRIRGNAEWKAIETAWKWGAPLILPALYALYEKARHLDRDWYVFSGFLVVGLLFSGFGYVNGRTKKDLEKIRPSNETPPSWDGYESAEAWGKAVEAQQKKVSAEGSSTQGLRDQIATLAGDLCGYLIRHRKELNPPDDPNTTGFEFIPDDLEIVSTFEQEFGARLAAVRMGLGNVGLLLSNNGEVLENGAANSDEVRRIIDRLTDSVGLLDSRCGTKAPAVVIVKPDPCVGLFSPLQIEAFYVAKEARTLAESKRRPVIDPRDYGADEDGALQEPGTLAAYMTANSAALNQWRHEIRARYDLSGLKSRANKLYLRFVDEAHIADHHLASLVDTADTDEALLDMTATIRKIAFQLEEVKP